VLRLHDTASGRTEELETRAPGRAGLYICGSTVYGPPHIGHGRFSLVYDILRRFLEYRGMAVDHVSNVTDIDDKIINKANEEHRSSEDVAAQYEEEWWGAMSSLGCLLPTQVPHATAFIEQMVELISALAGRGSAYETSDGVYFAVSAVADYGLLAHQSLDSLRSGARVEVNEEKRSPLDFALWKKAKPGEPWWASPWGPGRPGWHTECVVMSLALLGDGFDLHGGGQDLIFPHHENERAQSVAIDRPFARRWMHNGMVEARGGEKMSKSLGNVLLLSDLFEQTDPRAYRLLVLQSHYRAPIEVTTTTLGDAESALDRLDMLSGRLAEAVAAAELSGEAAVAGLWAAGSAAAGLWAAGSGAGGSGVAGSGAGAEVRRAFVERMRDDLDTPGATAGLFDAIRKANVAFDARESSRGAELAQAVFECFGAVGLEAKRAAEIPESVLELGRRRDRARAERDFSAADSLRAEIVRLGYVVEDTPGGTRIRR
jgi:cysteinyl-tRNA synthetase